MNILLRLLSKSGVTLNGKPLWIAPSSRLDCGSPGAIELGERCVLSEGVSLLTHDYSLDRISELLSGQVGETELYRERKVVVGDLAFIGMNAILMPGTTVGRGSIIGAGSVVTVDVPERTVWAGNPARHICSVEDYWQRHRDTFVEKTRRI